MWTQFWDMHSGGSLKEPPYDKIYIEASEVEACTIFYNVLGHNPHDVGCECCGPNYSIQEEKTIEELSKVHRTEWSSKEETPIEEYLKSPNILVLREEDIKPEERIERY
jgi:hypothetical protein